MGHISKYCSVAIILLVLFLIGCSDEPATPDEIKVLAQNNKWDSLKKEYMNNEMDSAKTDQEKEVLRNSIISETFKFRVSDGENFFLQEVYLNPLNFKLTEKVLNQCLNTDTRVPSNNLLMLYLIINEPNTRNKTNNNELTRIIIELFSRVERDFRNRAFSKLVNICASSDQNNLEFKSQLASYQTVFSDKLIASLNSENCEAYLDLLIEIMQSGDPQNKTEVSYYDIEPIFTYLIRSQKFEGAAELLTKHMFIDTTALQYSDFQPVFEYLLLLEKYDLALQSCSSFAKAETRGFQKLVLKAIELEKLSIGANLVEALPNNLFFLYNDLKPIIMYHAYLGNLNIARELALFKCIDHPLEYDTMKKNYTKSFKLHGTIQMLGQNIQTMQDKLDGVIEDTNDCIKLGGYIVAELDHNAGITEYEIELYSGNRAILTTYSTRYQSTGSFSLLVKKFGSRQVKTNSGFTENWVEYIESVDCFEPNELEIIRAKIGDMQSRILQINDSLKSIRQFELNYFGLEFFFDLDGNSYRTVKIGNQTWMAENLKVTRYRDGTEIKHVNGKAAWPNISGAAYCIYNNNASNEVDTYGVLYNWHTVNGDFDGNGEKDKEIAPEGWHIPTDDEWKELELALGMTQNEADTIGWRGTNEGSKLAGNENLWDGGELKNDELFGASDFNALPNGYREIGGHPLNMGTQGSFWSATELTSTSVWYRKLSYNNSEVYRDTLKKGYGVAIRCVKDISN